MTKPIQTAKLFTSFELAEDEYTVDKMADIKNSKKQSFFSPKSSIEKLGLKDKFGELKERYMKDVYLHNGYLFSIYYELDHQENRTTASFREVRDADTKALCVLAQTDNSGDINGEYVEYHPDGKTVKIKTKVESGHNNPEYFFYDAYEEYFSNANLKVKGEIYDTETPYHQPLIGLVVEGDEEGNQKQCLYSFVEFPGYFEDKSDDKRIRVILTDIKEQFVESLEDVELIRNVEQLEDECVEARCRRRQPTTLGMYR